MQPLRPRTCGLFGRLAFTSSYRYTPLSADGDDGLEPDDDDISPASNRVTRLHRLRPYPGAQTQET